jgi:hypothetical protein
MAKRRNHTHVAFADRSCRHRKLEYIRLKNSIRKHADEFGGLVWCLPEYNLDDDFYVSFYFIGESGTIYDAYLKTARYEYSGAVKTAAIKATHDRAPNDPWEHYERTKQGTTRCIFLPGPKEAYDGLDRFEWLGREERRIAQDREVSVLEETRLNRDYSSGVGLYAVVDVETFNSANVNEFVRRFIANGEKPFKGQRPLCFGFEPTLFNHLVDRPTDDSENIDCESDE